MIQVSKLCKNYRVRRQGSGSGSLLRSFFAPEYDDVAAVKDVSFSIGKGECVGYIGPNGAGKSTTLKILSGIMCPTSGHCIVAGFVPWERDKEFLRTLSFFAGQKGQLIPDLSPIDTYKFLAAVYELESRLALKRAGDYAEMLGITGLLNKPVRLMSLGQRMKFELIGAFLHNPGIVFMDEPTLGLDIWAQADVYECLTKLNLHNNSTIILTSHHMSDIEKLCKRVILLESGQILSDSLLSDLRMRAGNMRKLKALADSRENLARIHEIFAGFSPAVDPEGGKITAIVPLDLIQNIQSETMRYCVRLDIEEEPLSDLIKRVYVQ